MSKSMTVNQLEHQIETLPLAEQIRMLEKLVRNLKQCLVPSPLTSKTSMPKSANITEQLNSIYAEENSHLNSHFVHAQSVTLAKDEWQ